MGNWFHADRHQPAFIRQTPDSLVEGLPNGTVQMGEIN
jgi:hypothetical protein